MACRSRELPTGAERGFRGRGPERGLSSGVSVLGGGCLGFEFRMTCTQRGECGGELTQVVGMVMVASVAICSAAEVTAC